MKLGLKQEIFAEDLAHLILIATEHMGLGVRLREVWRTKEQAEIYAAQGKGILNSNHRNGLAADLILTCDNQILWDGPEYEELAEAWRKMNMDGLEHCWGGDFARRDVYHYSIKHRGVV